MGFLEAVTELLFPVPHRITVTSLQIKYTQENRKGCMYFFFYKHQNSFLELCDELADLKIFNDARSSAEII